MGRIILGLIIIVVGAAITIKTEPVFQFTGAIAWAEEHVGSTRFFLKLMGVLAIIIGMATMTGLIGNIIISIVGLFFPQLKNQ